MIRWILFWGILTVRHEKSDTSQNLFRQSDLSTTQYIPRLIIEILKVLASFFLRPPIQKVKSVDFAPDIGQTILHRDALVNKSKPKHHLVNLGIIFAASYY